MDIERALEVLDQERRQRLAASAQRDDWLIADRVAEAIFVVLACWQAGRFNKNQ